MREYSEYWPYCQYCENRFMATRQDAKYCSPKCRTAAHRKTKKPNFAMALDKKERDDLWYLKSLSGRGYNTILAIYRLHGFDAARLAMLACIQVYDNQNVAIDHDGKPVQVLHGM